MEPTKSFQLCLTLCNQWTKAHQSPLSMGILQAWILKWVAISFSRGSSWLRGWTHVSYVSCTGTQVLYHFTTKWSLGHVIWAPGSSCAWVVVTWTNKWSLKLKPFGVRLLSLAAKDILSNKTYIISLWQMKQWRLRGSKLPAQGHTLGKQRS